MSMDDPDLALYRTQQQLLQSLELWLTLIAHQATRPTYHTSLLTLAGRVTKALHGLETWIEHKRAPGLQVLLIALGAMTWPV